jgi:hypothetical protein
VTKVTILGAIGLGTKTHSFDTTGGILGSLTGVPNGFLASKRDVAALEEDRRGEVPLSEPLQPP